MQIALTYAGPEREAYIEVLTWIAQRTNLLVPSRTQ